jgi:hypothetical protein
VEFQVDPTPLSRHRGRPILAATAVVVIVVAAVVGALAIGSRGPMAVVATASTTAGASPVPSPSVPTRPSAPTRSSVAAVVPTGPAPRITCHGVAGGRCSAIAEAALVASIDPALPSPTRVDVWSSLLCGSVFDCPPDRLIGRQAAGSAVVVAGTTGLWVNVLAPVAGSRPATFEAWVIRSGPIG